MKQFVALARVSSREQEREGFSLDIQEEGVPVTDPRRVRELLEPALDATLEDLAATALLIR